MIRVANTSRVTRILYWTTAFLVVAAILAFIMKPALAQATRPNSQGGSTSIKGAGACPSMIVNGDFESTGGWTEYSKSGAALISTFPPPSGAYHSGQHGAYLGDYNNARDYIAQAVYIPADASQAQFTFWWQVESSESKLTARDTLTVTLDSPLETPLVTLYALDNRDQGTTWKSAQIDLTSHLSRLAGRTLYLRFEAQTDANLLTAFYMDDISLGICQSTPTPTPSPTPTVQHRYFMPGIWH